MKAGIVRWGIALGLVAVMGSSVRAQGIPVYDASNWVENVLQYLGLRDQLRLLTYQLQRLPVDMATRYRILTRFWPPYDSTDVRFVRAFLAALNTGDPGGAAYRALVTALDLPDDVLAKMPPRLRTRLQTQYGALELADRVTRMGVDQTSHYRVSSDTLQNVLQRMQTDAASPENDYHSQTALLNKINAAAVLDLRVGEKTNEFLAAVIEQLTVDQTRRRQTEAALMNATLAQWRYGLTYGEQVFQHTAASVDGWRLR